ncbi:hypothetical protein A9196_17055 [Aeromonas dhakensis]|nr:hypothetical protein A9196_17055 [Aeromonas dhakensis]
MRGQRDACLVAEPELDIGDAVLVVEGLEPAIAFHAQQLGVISRHLGRGILVGAGAGPGVEVGTALERFGQVVELALQPLLPDLGEGGDQRHGYGIDPPGQQLAQLQLVHGDLLEVIGGIGEGGGQLGGIGEILGHPDAPGFQVGQRLVADLQQVGLAHEKVPAVADMGLLGVDEVAFPLRLVGVGHHHIANTGFCVAGETGTGIGQLDLDGDLESAKDGGDDVDIEPSGLLSGIEVFERGFHRATDDQLPGKGAEREQ